MSGVLGRNITALIIEKHNKNLFIVFSSREHSQDYYSSYTSNQYKGYFALCSALKNQEIVLMSSSELHDQDSPFFPNKFFKEAIKQNLKSFGSKGFQVKIIASILSACLPYVAPNQSKLVIIISPIWFLNDPAQGINVNFRNFELQSVGNLPLYEINKSNLPKSIKEELAPPLTLTEFLFERYHTYFLLKDLIHSSPRTSPLKPLINQNVIWEDVYREARKYDRKNISKPIYSLQEMHNFTQPEMNTEIKNLKMLIEILQIYDIPTRFILLPMNAKLYKNFNRSERNINVIKDIIERSGYPYLNLWDLSLKQSILKDYFHPNALGWTYINEFIYQQYILK